MGQYPYTEIIFGFEVPEELQDAVTDLYEDLDAAGYTYEKAGWETSDDTMAVGISFGAYIDLPAMNAMSINDLASLIALLKREVPELEVTEPTWFVISSIH